MYDDTHDSYIYMTMFCDTGATIQRSAFYGQGTGLIVLDNLECTGSELSLFSCRHSGINSHNCDHSEDVGVTCMGKLHVTCNTSCIKH